MVKCSYGFSHLEPCGAIWSHLEPSGTIWSPLEPSGATWSHLEPSGAFWSHLESSGAIWSHLEPSGAHVFSGGVRWHSSCVLFHYVVMVLGVSGGLVAFILSHVVIVLVVSGALWPPHWYYLSTPKHDYHDSRVLGWISGAILGHLGCHGPPSGTIGSPFPPFLYSWFNNPGFIFLVLHSC